MQEQLPSPASTGATGTATTRSQMNGGRFDFDDGGTYCGGWEDGKAHGHGVCTGPKGQGAYSGSWHYGFEVSGVYTWPSGSCFEGQWQNGKRHGLGVETRGRWIYRGEWTQGFKGRYGVRQSNTSTAKYEGTWANGLQDGYGSETYADDGTYQGQWMLGMRHGYGVRNSAPFGKASKYRIGKTLRASLTSLRSAEGAPGAPSADLTDKRDRRIDDSRGGFVLKMNSAEPTSRRRSIGSGNIKKGLFMGLKLKKQRSTGELEKRGGGSGSIRSTGSTASWLSSDSAQSAVTNASIPSDSNASFVVEDEQMDPKVTETYMGEWKNDKRCGYGVSERSDGLKYEGEWYNNKKYGYGVTTFTNGEKEEGKYKNNVLITSQKKRLFLMRSAKFRERIDSAVNAAQRASKIALQKADIAISRTATARGKAEQADIAAAQAREDFDLANSVAKQYAPDFKQPALERLKARRFKEQQMQQQKPSEETAVIESGHQQNQLPSQLHNNTSNQPLNSSSNPGKLNMNQISADIPDQLPSRMPNTVSNQHQQKHQQNQGYYDTRTGPDNQSFPAPNDNFYNPTKSPGWNASSANHNPAPAQNDLMMKNSTDEPLQNQKLPQQKTFDYSTANNVRRMSRRVSNERPYLGSLGQQSSIDHFDHYKRPPSRDSSVDRYSRAAGQLGGSRQPSVDRAAVETPERASKAPSLTRGATPVPATQPPLAKNGSVLTGRASPQPPFEDILLQKKNLGQDIVPSPNQPKRTESLYVPGTVPKQPQNAVTVIFQPHCSDILESRIMLWYQEEDEEDLLFSPALMARRASESWIDTPPIENLAAVPTTLSRKKSLPDVQDLPRATEAMSREEVSYLGSARREEVRRMADEKERLRANPLLYLVSPQVKAWFSRQQLVIVVIFVNVTLAIMFFKLLTT